ncbi:MAG: hypothetical protein AAB638_02405 [Patescibacteria group bacterium]
MKTCSYIYIVSLDDPIYLTAGVCKWFFVDKSFKHTSNVDLGIGFWYYDWVSSLDSKQGPHERAHFFKY